MLRILSNTSNRQLCDLSTQPVKETFHSWNEISLKKWKLWNILRMVTALNNNKNATEYTRDIPHSIVIFFILRSQFSLSWTEKLAVHSWILVTFIFIKDWITDSGTTFGWQQNFVNNQGYIESATSALLFAQLATLTCKKSLIGIECGLFCTAAAAQ